MFCWQAATLTLAIGYHQDYHNKEKLKELGELAQ
jgi:hypothetical protein